MILITDVYFRKLTLILIGKLIIDIIMFILWQNKQLYNDHQDY